MWRRDGTVVRAIGSLLILCVALAVVKAAMVALLLMLAIALIWALCMHPREVFGFMAYCAVMGMVNAHPTLVLAAIVLLIVVGQLNRK